MRSSLQQKVRRGLVVVGLLGLIATGLVHAFDPSRSDAYRLMNQRLDKVRVMNQKVAEENRLLLREIDACRNDVRYVRRYARRELRALRPNETVYTFQ